jgi:hypothetical protein
MSEDVIDHKEYLFEQLEMISEFKRVKNKNYGWIKCKPNSLIGVIVRTKNVTVEFITEGKKNDLGSDVFLSWVVKSGILKKELANGKKFELNEGTKNKNKVCIVATMGIQKEEDLSERHLITFCEDTMNLLLGETEGFLEVKPQASSGSEDDDDDDYVSPMSKYIHSIRDELDSIIDNNSEEFKSSKSFKVRPGIAYDKFYLDRVAGSYDQSLQGLIHHMMWERKHYHEILPESQVSVVAKIIKEEPDSIYGPDYDDESMSEEECEELDDNINAIYFDVIKHVGQRLKEFDFFDNSEFEDGGYVDED